MPASERRYPLPGGATLVVTWDPGSGSAAESVDAVFGGLESALARDPARLLEAVGKIMRRSFAENFRQGGRPDRWTPLRPSTVSHKAGQIGSGKIPRLTPTGKVPRRLMQLDRTTGVASYGPSTVLIARGDLRDSYAQKGARGNVSQILGRDGVFGSQLTEERHVPANRPVAKYVILTKKAQKARGQGSGVQGKIPVARFHEEGTKKMPARRVATRADGTANMQDEDLLAIQGAQLRWVAGEDP